MLMDNETRKSTYLSIGLIHKIESGANGEYLFRIKVFSIPNRSFIDTQYNLVNHLKECG